MSAKASDEAAQGQRSWDRPRSIPEPAALGEIWAIQGSDKGWLENSACLGVKNIGKPCALVAHARIDEGGQAKPTRAWLMRRRRTKGAETGRPSLRKAESCSLLYP